MLVGLLLTGKFSVPVLLAVARSETRLEASSIGSSAAASKGFGTGAGFQSGRRRSNVRPAGTGKIEGGRCSFPRCRCLETLSRLSPGVLREPLLPFTILVFVAKTGRYVVLTLATLQIVG